MDYFWIKVVVRFLPTDATVYSNEFNSGFLCYFKYFFVTLKQQIDNKLCSAIASLLILADAMYWFADKSHVTCMSGGSLTYSNDIQNKTIIKRNKIKEKENNQSKHKVHYILSNDCFLSLEKRLETIFL